MERGTLTEAEGQLDISRLYEEHGDRLWRAVFAFTHDRETTDDAVAEAFAQCIRRGGDVRDPMAWVWKAAFRIAAGGLKERGRSVAQQFEPSYEMPEEPGRLIAMLRELPKQQRACLVLRHYVGYDTDEIATILGISRATVRVHLSRGRRALRTLMEEVPDERS